MGYWWRGIAVPRPATRWSTIARPRSWRLIALRSWPSPVCRPPPGTWRALDTAAESDTATGGVDRAARIFPIIKTVSDAGITTLPEEKIAAVFERAVA